MTTHAPDQGTHHYILTLQVPFRSAVTVLGTWTGCVTPQGMTRADVYDQLRARIAEAHPDYAQGNVIFFALERNEL